MLDHLDVYELRPLPAQLGQPMPSTRCPLSRNSAGPAYDREGRKAVDPAFSEHVPALSLNRTFLGEGLRPEMGRHKPRPTAAYRVVG